MESVRRVPVPAFLAALASLAWIGLALSEPAALATLRAEPTVTALVDLAARVLVVPALLFAIAAALRQPQVTVRQDLLAASEATEAGAVAAAGSLASRLASVREMLELDVAAVEALAGTLEQRAAAASGQLREATAAAERIGETARALDAGISAGLSAASDLAGRLEQLGALIEGQRLALQQAGAELEARRAYAQTAHAALAEAARASGEAIAAHGGRAQADAQAALAAASQASETLAAAIAGHRAELDAAVSEARTTLAAIGSEAARALGRHLETLVGQARELEARIAGQAGVTEELVKTADQGFQILDKRLEHSAATTGRTLEQLQARLQAAAGAIDALAEPLRTGRGEVSQLEAAVAAVRESALALTDLLAGTVPKETVAATAAAETLGAEVRRLLETVEQAHARAEALAEPVRDSQAVLDAVTARFEAQREAVQVAGEALVVELEQARQLVAEVERATEATSLAAATRLVDALTRVREVSAQATGTMRDMLEGIVAEAREALGAAARDSLRAGFVEPVAEQAAAAEARARAAAERSARSLASLAEALRLVDARTETRLRELTELGGRELVGAAQLLTDRLASEAVTISSALGREMDAEDWAKWRAGERGLFKRRALALLDRHEAKELKALIARDAEFAGAARRFTAGFEALVERLEGSQGAGLAAIIRSSDTGRLAAALSEVLAD